LSTPRRSTILCIARRRTIGGRTRTLTQPGNRIMQAPRKADLVIVGLGAMGAAAAYQAACRPGLRVVGIDRFAPPHDQGSTHGETRITRLAVGEGPEFAPFVIRSHAIWRELEATPHELLVPCGYLAIGPADGRSADDRKPAFMARTLAVAERFGIEHAVLDRGELAARYPQFSNLGLGDQAYFEPGGGFVYPERCVAAQLAEARRLGATLLTDTTVDGIAQEDGAVRIATTAGEIVADQAIVAAGAWTAVLLGAPFRDLLEVTRQVLFWFETDRPEAFAPERCPVFIRMLSAARGNTFYGFPMLPGAAGVKVATEQYEVMTAPDAVARAVPAAEAAQFYARYVGQYLAGVSDRLIAAKTCLYTSTKLRRTGEPSSNFLIDRHPSMDRVLVVSACSGHGFKHSAAIGEAAVERAVTGSSTLDLSPFRLERFL
jgi:sarcosine oxidase